MIQALLGGMGAGAAGALGTLFVQLSADSTKMVKGMQEARQSLSGTSAIMLKQAAVLAAGVTAAFTAIGVVAIREFMKFDKAMTEATAIMGDLSDTTKKEMAEVARALSGKTTQSADQLAQAYYYLASAGLDAEQSMKALSLVVSFATAGVFDLSAATTLLADAQSALGLLSKDAEQNLINMTRVADVLVEANNMANASTREFSEALTNKAAAALRNAKKSVEEGVAVLAVFADQGLKGAAAGESLTIVLRDLQNTAMKNTKEMEAFGVKVYDSVGNMRNLSGIVADLEKSLAGASVEQQRMTFTLMGFQDRSLAAIMSLIGTSDRIREYEDRLERAGQTTKNVSDKQLKSLSSQLEIVKNLFVEVFITIGESLAPAFQELLDLLKEMVDPSTEMNRLLKEMSETIGVLLVKSLRGAIELFILAKDIFGSLVVGFLYGLNTMLAGLSKVLPAMEFIITRFLGAMAERFNLIMAGLNLIFKTIIKMDAFKLSFPKGIREEIEAQVQKGVRIDVEAITAPFFSTIDKKVNEARKGMEAIEKLFWQGMTENPQPPTKKLPVVDMVEQAGKAIKELTDGIKEDFGGAYDAIKNFVTGLGDLPRAVQVIETTKMTKLIDLLGLPPGFRQREMPTAKDLMAAITMGEQGFDSAKVTELLRGAGVETGGGGGLLAGAVEGLGRNKAFQDEIRSAQDKLRILQDLGNEEVLARRAKLKAVFGVFTEENRMLEEMEKKRNQSITSYQDYISQLQIGQINELLQNAGIKPGTAPLGADVAMNQMVGIQNELQLNQERLKALQEIGDQEAENVEEVQRRKSAAIEAFYKKNRELQLAQASVLMSTWEQSLSSLSDAVKGFSDEQSGVYQAMFAASKAFAIADAIIKIQQAIAQAWGDPSATTIWQKFAGVAAIVSATASIISNIQAVSLSFAGKRAEGGPVSPGKAFLVGEEGPELFVPSARGGIISNEDIGRSSVKVVVNNHTDAKATVTEREDAEGRVVEIMIQRVKDDLASEIRDGRGGVARAMESTFALRRGRV